MKTLKTFLTIFIFTIFIISCKSTELPPQETPASVPEQKTAFVEEVTDEPILIFDDDEVDEEEFIRSTNNLSADEIVTKQEFSDDKADILRIIDELAEIMEAQDVNAWLSYLDPESIKYYSAPANIRKAQKKLPDKTIQLYGIGDYFKYVFIPSRKRSEVDEIRYISKTNIKAVKVKDDNSINVYYYFVKIDGQWLVHIPTL